MSLFGAGQGLLTYGQTLVSIFGPPSQGWLSHSIYFSSKIQNLLKEKPSIRADVFCNDNPIGTIDWTPDACGVRRVDLDYAICGDELLRCYAVVNGNILRVGLPAPEHGRLRLHRHLSRQMLHETGCEEPERFYLASAPEPLPPEQCAARAAACHRRYGLDALYPAKTCRFSREDRTASTAMSV